jgi:hypothetical protein
VGLVLASGKGWVRTVQATTVAWPSPHGRGSVSKRSGPDDAPVSLDRGDFGGITLSVEALPPPATRPNHEATLAFWFLLQRNQVGVRGWAAWFRPPGGRPVVAARGAGGRVKGGRRPVRRTAQRP